MTTGRRALGGAGLLLALVGLAVAFFAWPDGDLPSGAGDAEPRPVAEPGAPLQGEVERRVVDKTANDPRREPVAVEPVAKPPVKGDEPAAEVWVYRWTA